MSFIDEVLPTLRVIIGDDESPYTYNDTRLTDILYSVAKLLVAELPFDTQYTVTLSTQTISPSPEEDIFFTTLLPLKAAVYISNSEYKAAALSSGSVVDGPTTIDLGSSATSLLARMKAVQSDYDKAKLQYSVGNAIGCQFVLSTCQTLYSECYDNGQFNYNRYRDGCLY